MRHLRAEISLTRLLSGRKHISLLNYDDATVLYSDLGSYNIHVYYILIPNNDENNNCKTKKTTVISCLYFIQLLHSTEFRTYGTVCCQSCATTSRLSHSVTEHFQAETEDASCGIMTNIVRRRCGVSAMLASSHKCSGLLAYLLHTAKEQ